MSGRCRLCRELAVEDSLFCERHRSQAALFSSVFGPKQEPPATGDVAGTTLPSPGTSPTSSAAQSADGALLAKLLVPVAAALVDPKESESQVERWPQVSIYFLGDQLFVRWYFSVVPKSVATSNENRFSVAAPEVQRALGVGGELFEEVIRQFVIHAVDLRGHKAETLDLHLVTYAGLAAINLHAFGQKDCNLEIFALQKGAFRRVRFAEVLGRLGHNHWSCAET